MYALEKKTAYRYREMAYVILLFFMLFMANYINKYIILFISIILFWRIYEINKKRGGVYETLIILLIYSLPLSFKNVLGGYYGELPISWFNILGICVVGSALTLTLKKNKIRNLELLLMGIYLLIFGLFFVIKSYNYIDALKQYINIALFIGLIISAPIIRTKMRFNAIDNIKRVYINTIFITSLFLLLQYLLYKIFFIEQGFIMALGPVRIAFGFLFTDFSFLSLYLASGAAIIFQQKNKDNTDKIKFIIIVVACIISSARTGIFAFIIVIVLNTMIKLLKVNKESIAKIIFMMIFLLISYSVMTTLRGPQVMDGSGRIEGYMEALSVFNHHKLTGIGLGVTNYREVTGLVIPHNFIIQILVQTGVIYTTMMGIFIGIILNNMRERKSAFKLAVWTVLIGSLLIPDILNSRFLPVLLLSTQLE